MMIIQWKLYLRRMRKLDIFLFILLFVTLLSCSDTRGPKNSPTEQRKDTTLTPEQRSVQIRANREGAYDRNSAFAYLVSDPEMGIWAGMVRRSKWAETLKNGPWLILGIKNELLLGLGEEKLKALRDPNKSYLMDEFVGRYIVKENLTLAKETGVKQLATISGENIELQPGGRNIGTAIYSEKQIMTASGSVVYLTQLMLQDLR